MRSRRRVPELPAGVPQAGEDAESTYMDLAAQQRLRTAARRRSQPAAQQAIFCSWNQTHAGTGRLSTSLPNLQSLPTRQPHC